jgi:hypothetical protein
LPLLVIKKSGLLLIVRKVIALLKKTKRLIVPLPPPPRRPLALPVDAIQIEVVPFGPKPKVVGDISSVTPIIQ